jgi:hypothetical protein
MKNSTLRRKMLSMCMLVTALLFSLLSSANIIITAMSLPNATIGVVYNSPQFTATGTDAAGATWLMNGADVATMAAYGLSFNTTTQILSGTPTMSFPSPGLSFRIDAINGAAADEKTFMLIINRTGMDLVLVLDKSGSMGYSFDGSNLNAPMGQRRYDGLIVGTNVMESSLMNPNTLVPGDMIGLRYFESTVTLPGAPFNAGLVTLNGASLTSLKADIGAHGPGSNTALGDGILAGKALLLPGTSGNGKAMILFSDGVQNSGDQVQTTGPDAYVKTMSGADLAKNTEASFPIYTVCLGSSGDNPTLMESIAQLNGKVPYFNSMTGDNNDFMMNSFLGQMQSVLSGHSPEYVDVRTGTFQQDSLKQWKLQESFTTNKSAYSVFVALATSLSATIVSVKKDGVELNQFIHTDGGTGYRTFYINLPIGALPTVKPEGVWTITAMGRGATVAAGGGGNPSYTISMTVEDPINHLGFSLGGKNFKIGDVLNPTVSITRVKTPYSGATVQAIVVKPGDDINDLLARSDVAFTNPPGDSSSPNIGKLAVLLKDSAFLAKIKASNRTVNLTFDSTTKSYSGSFSDLDIVGVYRVIYRITSTDTVNGTLNRYFLGSFNVRFKDVDMPNSNVVLSVDPITHNGIISIRPISSTGKYIGPGWGSSIGLVATGLKIQRIEDVGDGTYKLHLDGPVAGDGVVTIANDTIYNGALGDITKAGSGGGGGSIFHHWWFWLILLLILLLIIIALRKKKP